MRRSHLVRLRLPVCLFAALLIAACRGSSPSASPFEIPESAEDGLLRVALERRLAAEPSLTARQIRVETRGGTVLLHGIVYGLGEWQCALANAELTPGVQTVVDYLVLGRGPPQIPCLAPRPLPQAG